MDNTLRGVEWNGCAVYRTQSVGTVDGVTLLLLDLY